MYAPTAPSRNHTPPTATRPDRTSTQPALPASKRAMRRSQTHYLTPTTVTNVPASRRYQSFRTAA